MVELSAVNRSVVGSSPAEPWPVGQVVKTPPFHGGNTGSNPVGHKKSQQYADFLLCVHSPLSTDFPEINKGI